MSSVASDGMEGSHFIRRQTHIRVRTYCLRYVISLSFFAAPPSHRPQDNTQIKKHEEQDNGNDSTMALVLRRSATIYAHAHVATARTVRTTSQHSLASSSTDFSKPSKWSVDAGGRRESSGSIWEGHPFV